MSKSSPKTMCKRRRIRARRARHTKKLKSHWKIK
jgi:hypothetical protein